MSSSSSMNMPDLPNASPPAGGRATPPPTSFTGGSRSYIDAVLRVAATGSATTILLMLGALLAVLFLAALPSIRHFGPGFLVSSQWRPEPLPVLKRDANGKTIHDPETMAAVVDHDIPPQFGAFASLYGTAVTSALALLLAVPLSLGAALYIVRIAPHRLIAAVSFLIEFLAAIPSIAYGLWGMFVLGPWMGGPARIDYPLAGLTAAAGLRRLPGISLLARLPIPAGVEGFLSWLFLHVPGLSCLATQKLDGKTVLVPTSGRDLLVAGVTLGIMIIPIITAISRDVLKNVPRAQIEGTIALGATWWQSCTEMLKYSRGALSGAVILGLARAAGETMAVLMVMGGTATVARSPFQAGATMASLLAGEFPAASTNDLYRGALMELALILLVMSLLFNVVARYLVVGKSARTAVAY